MVLKERKVSFFGLSS